ncbi:MAG TPA: hypothetical protein VJ826_11760 [Candidatus Polarisedimenticolaceae bacterium]|nr:hypothetical protein [Candidatus Polarisedimenticolaceae bacterium]
MLSSLSGLVLCAVVLVPDAAFTGVAGGALQETPKGPAHLIKDVNTTPDLKQRSFTIPRMIRAGQLVYFEGYLPNRSEIWRTDGTPGGTIKIFDGLVEEWWDGDGVLYFSTLNFSPPAEELWRSDGTKAGTRLVKRFPYNVNFIGVRMNTHQGSLFPLLDEDNGGTELWRTDGTESGTVLVKDGFPYITEGVWSGSTFYFTGGYGLWKSDGTTDGTVQVTLGCAGGRVSDGLAVLNGRLYFRGDDCRGGTALFSSDGTEDGTVLVKSFVWDYYYPAPFDLTAIDGVLYFGACDDTDGCGLWKSDGSPGGTTLIANVPGVLAGFAPAGGAILFTAGNATYNGQQIWKSDGTAAGTVLVRDFTPGSGGSSIWNETMTVANGVLYFTAGDGPHGFELWRSDGTQAGTFLLKDIMPGPSGVPIARPIAALGATVIFPAADPTHGYEVWRTDGTSAGTTLLRDVNPSMATSNSMFVASRVAMGRDLFFAADDGVHGPGLWKSDGTPGGTTLLKSISFQGWFPQLWRAFGGNVVFTATDVDHGTELWKSDGTPAGTVLVKDIFPGFGFASPSPVGTLGGALYFVASDGGPRRSLWKTDLTEAGTALVHEGLGQCADSVVVNGMLYFSGDDGEHGCELWKIDASTGAQMVKNIRPDDQTLYPPVAFFELNGRVFFFVDDGVHGLEPWTSDGTEQGTHIVKDVYPGPARSITFGVPVAIGGKIYYPADDGVHGGEIWVTDGTEEGTHLFVDVTPGPDGSYASQLVSVGGKLTFVAFTPDYLDQWLWSSDGTDEGTVALQKNLLDFTSGTVIDGDLYYGADLPGAQTGFALWRSDGTAKGTAQAQVIDPSSWALDVSGQDMLSGFTKIGHRLFFFADDGVSGLEPWVGWASVLANRPAQAIADLRDEVSALNLPSNVSAALLASLRTAERALRGGNSYAIPWLETFAQQVNAQIPQWIVPEAAAELVDFAEGIIGLLEPRPTPPVE